MKNIVSLIHPQHIRLILVMLTLWFSEPAQSQKKLYTATKSFSSAWTLEWNVDTSKRYILKVSGVYGDGVWQGQSQFLDAAFDFRTLPAIKYNSCPLVSRWRFKDSCAIRPDTDMYSSAHVYYYTFKNRDGSVSLDYLDNSYGDNSGSLTFELYESCDSYTFNPFADTLNVCGNSTLLDVGTGFASYLWSSGQTARTLNVSQNGWNKVTVVDSAGCIKADSVYVSFLSVNILNSDTSICGPATLQLSIDSASIPATIACTNTDLSSTFKNQLLVYYPFCGNAQDISGGAKNGTVTGPVLSADRYGNTASSYAFSGGTQKIVIPLTQANVSVYTVSLWFKTTEGGALLSGRGSNGENGLTANISTVSAPPYTGRLSWIGDLSGGATGKMTKALLNDGKWHHFVGTFSSVPGSIIPSFFNIYIDGVLSATDNITTGTPVAPINNNTQMVIGNHQLWVNEGFKGSIDEVAIWSRVLPVSEIEQLYQSKKTITWSTGEKTNSIRVTPTQSTTYKVTISDGYRTCSDSVRVQISGLTNFNPFPSRLYSTADSIKLDIGTTGQQVLWSTGDTSSQIYVKYTGNYHVTAGAASGCTASDSVFVQFPDTVGLQVSTVTGICNRSVDVPVRVTGFRQLLTLQGSVNWNVADLRFDSIVAFGPTALQLNTANFGVSQTSAGRLTFSWNEANNAGLTLADSSILFTLRFTIQGNTVRSVPITITSNPTVLESYDAGLVKKTLIPSAGGVNVTCEFIISGKVLTPANHGVRNVVMTLTGGMSPATATTDSAGNYSFKVQPGTYTLTPAKTQESSKLNGVSTLDIALIQGHILQRTPFNSAYKVIAGDANNSAGITTADILALRRLVLGTDTTLPGNRIWAFVDGDQTFASVSNPFPFSSTKTLTNVSTDISHTFRGIKMGDVNYDRNPLLDQAPSGDTLRLFGEWTDTEDGYATLRVKSRALSGLMGWQSTLRWDAEQLMLQTVKGRVSGLGIGERWKDEGYLTISWNDPMAEGLNFSEGLEWLELRFRKSQQLRQTGVAIVEEKVMTEAFNKNFQSMGVKLEPVMLRGNAGMGQLRVYPNPVTSVMNVEWKMEQAGAATVRLLDAQGRVVHVQRGAYGVGMQRMQIRRSSGWSVSVTWMVQVECDGVIRNVPVIMVGEQPRP